jgi:hypothetical protein
VERKGRRKGWKGKERKRSEEKRGILIDNEKEENGEKRMGR